jgi:prenylcysteine oxidase/farnesylcysteine lyase
MNRKGVLVWLLLSFCLCADSFECNDKGDCSTAPAIAIVGAGIGGSSTAHYLKKLIPDAEITIYEKEDRLCGRILDFYVEGKKVEIGASIYHAVNHNIAEFVSEFNLTATKPFLNDSGMAIWDGKMFVSQESDLPFIGGFVDIVKMIWRYGLSPLFFKNVVSTLLTEWDALYSLIEPFHSTEELFQKLHLFNMTQVTAPDFLAPLGVSHDFSKELLGALTRVNYNTDVAKMNTFAVAVSAVGSGNDLFTVREGNKVLCKRLAESAKAEVVLNSPVKVVEKLPGVKSYKVHDKIYDVVIIAAPLELAGIGFTNVDIDEYVFSAREYQEVHVTFVAASGIHPSYFNAEKVPDHILTVEDPTVPFSSLAKLANISVADGRAVYKVFSRTEMCRTLLEQIFINNTIEHKTMIKAYPVLSPQKFVPIVLSDNLFYVNSFESVVSTMETETISGKNVAKLVAKSLGGVVKKI